MIFLLSEMLCGSQRKQMQDYAFLELPYPFIYGTDVAGTVAQVGSKVTQFKVGQRVTG